MQPTDPLAQHRHPFLKNLLEDELRRLTAGNTARQNELRQSISRRETELQDDYGIYRQFELHLDSLPFAQRPANERRKAVLYAAWEDEQRAELAGWKESLSDLQAQPIDGQQVFSNAKERLLSLLAAEAQELGLLSQQPLRENSRQVPIEQSTAPDSSAPVRSGNRARGGSRRRWVHSDRPDNAMTLDAAYQLVKDDASELAIAKVLARVDAREIMPSSSGDQIWKVKMSAVKAAGYIRL